MARNTAWWLSTALGVAVLGGSPAGAARVGEASLTEGSARETALHYVEEKIAKRLSECKPLLEALAAANRDRKDWSAFSEDWKKWSPADAEKNTAGYTYGEYMWSSRKDKEFRKAHTDSDASKALVQIQSSSGGAVAELFVTDAKGGNVCQTAVTSDWFQGDEEKFTKVQGTRELFAAEPKRDDTIGKTGVQVSVPLWDKDTFLGVAVVTIITDDVK